MAFAVVVAVTLGMVVETVVGVVLADDVEGFVVVVCVLVETGVADDVAGVLAAVYKMIDTMFKL